MRTDARTGIRDEFTGTPVDAAIDLWADWTMGRVGSGGCSSPAALLMLAKKLGIAPRGTATLPEMPAEAVQIDQLVAKLERPLKRPFKVYYLQYAPLEAKARACGLGTDPKALYRHVRRARMVLAASYVPPRGCAVPLIVLNRAHSRDFPPSKRAAAALLTRLLS